MYSSSILLHLCKIAKLGYIYEQFCLCVEFTSVKSQNTRTISAVLPRSFGSGEDLTSVNVLLSMSMKFLAEDSSRNLLPSLLGGKRVGKLLILIESEHCDDGCH